MKTNNVIKVENKQTNQVTSTIIFYIGSIIATTWLSLFLWGQYLFFFDMGIRAANGLTLLLACLPMLLLVTTLMVICHLLCRHSQISFYIEIIIALVLMLSIVTVTFVLVLNEYDYRTYPNPFNRTLTDFGYYILSGAWFR